MDGATKSDADPQSTAKASTENPKEAESLQNVSIKLNVDDASKVVAEKPHEENLREMAHDKTKSSEEEQNQGNSLNQSKFKVPDTEIQNSFPETAQSSGETAESSQDNFKAPGEVKSPEKLTLKVKLKAGPSTEQGKKMKKRRNSNNQEGQPKKKKLRKSDPNVRMLPTTFLEGGNIDDPLNLRTVDDNTKSPMHNGDELYDKYRDPRDPLIPVFIPDDPRDPLGLQFDQNAMKGLTAKEKKKLKRERRRTVGDPIVSPAIDQVFDPKTERDIKQVTKELQRRMHTNVKKDNKKKQPATANNRHIDYSKLTESEFNEAVSLMRFKSHKETRHGNYVTHFGTKLKFTDDRLDYLKKEWFQGKDVLDVGCNTGQFTLIIAKNLLPRKIVGIDIDEKLIATARKNINHFVDDKLTETASSAGLIKHKGASPPASFKQVYGGLEAPFIPSGRSNWKTTFPQNVSFYSGNYVPLNRLVLEKQEPEYDVIMCMLVNKWIHMNHGDQGMKMTFHRMFKQLRPGGVLIIEPHPWKSYTKIKKDCEVFFRNYYSIELKPDKFASYLCKQVGFREPKMLNCPVTAKGFSRQLLSFTKPQ